MQIGATRPDASILPLANAGKTSAMTSAASPLETGSSAPPPQTAASSWPVDEQAFFDAWGTSDSAHDLDGSGVVDGGDLGHWLSVQTEASTDQGLQNLLDAWGTADSDWDLNSDGIVDGIDLGLHLDGGVQSSATDPPPAEADLSIEGFADAWGTSNPAYDLNADGIVDGADLGTFLNQSAAATQDPSLMDRFMSSWGTDDPEFDFNGDGTVDGIDLGHLLGGESTEALRAPQPQEIDDIVARLTKMTMKRFDHDQSGMVPVKVFNFAAESGSAFDPDGDGLMSRDEVAAAIRSRIEGMQDADGLLDASQLDRFAQKWRNFTSPDRFGSDSVKDANRRHGMNVVGSVAFDSSVKSASGETASRVAQVLEKLGHSGVPSNMKGLLDQLTLPGTNAQAVMYQLLQENQIGSVEQTA